MPFKDFATYREINSQTEAWVEALQVVSASDLPAMGDYDQVLFTGCGSTYYLSLAAAGLSPCKTLAERQHNRHLIRSRRF